MTNLPARRLRVARVGAATASAAALLLLAACGSEGTENSTAEPSTPASSSAATTPSAPVSSAAPAASPSVAAGQVLEISLDGDDVRPNARELELKVGEKLTLSITSDRAGELHVHSTPEQYIDFKAGTTTKPLVINAPGKVEVEEHESGAVVALIEVR